MAHVFDVTWGRSVGTAHNSWPSDAADSVDHLDTHR